ncbi:MAG: NUDIX hydrolase [Acidobacteriota bacterium]
MPNPYKSLKYPRLTVDSFVRDRRGRLLLVQRGRPPYEGRWGLPGGFCEWKETTENCCRRETLEETGLRVRVGRLLGVYSKPDRDPRGHNVTVLYAATPTGGRLTGGDDAADARWFSRKQLRRLRFAFDHAKIVREQMARRPAEGPPSRGRRGAARG